MFRRFWTSSSSSTKAGASPTTIEDDEGRSHPEQEYALRSPSNCNNEKNNTKIAGGLSPTHPEKTRVSSSYTAKDIPEIAVELDLDDDNDMF
jgi:hypothetical protein